MTLNQCIVEECRQTPTFQQRFEIVERKGKGHPDSICDAIAEEVSLALCREYQAAFGQILHHNTDKAMLVAGRTAPRLRGGKILEPMRFVLGDRAASTFNGKSIKVGEIAESTAKQWLRTNLRFIDVDKHLIFQNELKEGSPELQDIFQRDAIGANDTSAAVGYAPLSETERLVIEAERWMNSHFFKEKFPEAGEDIKVMGIRRDRGLMLTVAVAFVDRFIQDAKNYFDRKELMRLMLTEYLSGKLCDLDQVSIQLNTLDDRTRGEDGMYLTVLGTSAEGGDCGQVGRGNRINGLIPLCRPISTEAAAGKNPVSHVGKIYSLLTSHIAQQVIQRVDGVAEIYVWLCSQIGQPLDKPLIASSQVIVKDRDSFPEVQVAVEAIIQQELAGIHGFCKRLASGEFPVW